MGIRPTSRFLCSLLTCGLLFGCAGEGDTTTSTDPTSTTAAETAPAGGESSAPVADQAAEGIPTDDGILAPGSPAPPISIAKWMQGEPVAGFQKGTVYVVEFWATWCGPCLQSMPHMAQLQTEYGDKVAFVGVTDEDEATITPFLDSPGAGGKKWSEVLTYRIALDDNRATNTSYMEAAQQGGIPHAFIVGKTGVVEWFGHPMEMDEPLAQVVDGSWDWKAARDNFLKEARTAKVMNDGMQRLSAAAGAGDFAGALVIVDELAEKLPDNPDLIQIRLTLMLQGKMFDDLNKTAAEQVEANFDDPAVLENISWLLATGSKGKELDLDLALKAAQRASEIEQDGNPSVLDTIAAVHAARGELTEAVAWQKKAVALAPQSQQLAASLAKYEAQLKDPEEAEAPEKTDPEESPKSEPESEESPAKADEAAPANAADDASEAGESSRS